MTKDHIKTYIKCIKPDYEIKQNKIIDKREQFIIDNDIGYVYLINIKGFEYYKVGISTSVNGRLKSMQTGIPFNLEVVKQIKVKNHREVEKILHNIYDDDRIRGEWFTFGKNKLKNVLMHYDRLCKEYRYAKT